MIIQYPKLAGTLRWFSNLELYRQHVQCTMASAEHWSTDDIDDIIILVHVCHCWSIFISWWI